MSICRQCKREIVGKTRHSLEVTVDESAREEYDIDVERQTKPFCSRRCKRDWMDRVIVLAGGYPSPKRAYSETK